MGINFKQELILLPSSILSNTTLLHQDSTCSYYVYKVQSSHKSPSNKELYQRDWTKKMKMKNYVDGKCQVKISDIQVGNQVLFWREATDKGTPPYKRLPLVLKYQKVSQVVAQRKGGTYIKTSHLESTIQF